MSQCIEYFKNNLIEEIFFQLFTMKSIFLMTMPIKCHTVYKTEVGEDNFGTIIKIVQNGGVFPVIFI